MFACCVLLARSMQIQENTSAVIVARHSNIVRVCAYIWLCTQRSVGTSVTTAARHLHSTVPSCATHGRIHRSVPILVPYARQRSMTIQYCEGICSAFTNYKTQQHCGHMFKQHVPKLDWLNIQMQRHLNGHILLSV